MLQVGFKCLKSPLLSTAMEHSLTPPRVHSLARSVLQNPLHHIGVAIYIYIYYGQEKDQMMHEIPVTAPVRSKSSYFPALTEPRVPRECLDQLSIDLFILLFVDFC